MEFIYCDNKKELRILNLAMHDNGFVAFTHALMQLSKGNTIKGVIFGGYLWDGCFDHVLKIVQWFDSISTLIECEIRVKGHDSDPLKAVNDLFLLRISKGIHLNMKLISMKNFDKFLQVLRRYYILIRFPSKKHLKRRR